MEENQIVAHAQAFVITFDDDEEMVSHFLMHPSWSVHDQYKHIINVLWEHEMLSSVKSFRRTGEITKLTQVEFEATARRNLIKNVLITRTAPQQFVVGLKRKRG